MSDVRNPLIPAGYDMAWSVIAVLVVALTITALVVLSRSAKRLTSTQALIWTLVVLFVPVVGPFAWLAIGRPAARAEGSG
jgi:hypothetical protein